MSISLPSEYGWVIAAGAFSGIVLTITSSLAGAKRKQLGVEYPNLYASDITAKSDPKALEFNCAQRGALNPHESLGASLFGLAAGGISHPRLAAGFGFAWGIGALLYYFGYASGKPDRRYSKGGLILRLASGALQILPLVTAYQLISKN